MSEPAHRKYLEKYAEPEARFAEQLEQGYGAVLVVPLHHEEPRFLADLEPALLAASARPLLIAVVNGTDNATAAAHEANQRVLTELAARSFPTQTLTPVVGSPASATLGRVGGYDLLLVDRATTGQRLPSDQGVGLARRIGMDIALGLHARGRVQSPWLGCTDGDARLPADYLAQNAATEPRGAHGVRRVALTLPFWHVPGGDAAVDAATAAYELSLRYYTLGLASAGSPYAYESMGSSIVVRAEAYAEVRGFPRRQAAEDFYLLDKLAKVGAVHRPARQPIELRSRRSARVPFGTGARVGELVETGQGLTTYHPRVFELLRVTLTALLRAALSRSETRVTEELSRALEAGSVGAVSSALDDLNALEALRETFGASPDGVVRKRRFLTWFDALRTLRFVHLVEGHAGLPRVPLLDALTEAPFTSFWRGLGKESGTYLNENTGRMAAFSAEQALPSDVGVENAILGSVNDC
ncbi:MAG: hypothetical protein EOO73_07130 [Myxococcales bacterium]|nr:MAG: hypothetical protein EOO73_07130 [Myxococcales bacterium]